MQRLAGRRACVTGAAGGIGRALALGCAREGAVVVCADIDAAGAAETVALIERGGGRAWAQTCDCSEAGEVEELLRRCVDEMGGADLLMANAGGSRGEVVPFLEMDPERWWPTLHRNLTTVYLCSLVFARHMAAGGGGAIVVTSSQLGEVVRPGMSHYSAAKGAVKQLVKAMAVDLAAHGVRVNALAPGPTLTPGNRAMFERPDVVDDNLRTIPLRRIAEPEEMVGAALYLASDEASFTTGATLLVDGGYTLL